jgi:hypothetical protein
MLSERSGFSQRRKGAKFAKALLSMTDALINVCLAKLVATAPGGVPGSIRLESI